MQFNVDLDEALVDTAAEEAVIGHHAMDDA